MNTPRRGPNEVSLLAHPSFSSPATRVNPLRDFIRPALWVTWIDPYHGVETHSSLLTQVAHSEGVGLMKPLQGLTLIAGRSLKEGLSHRSRHRGVGKSLFILDISRKVKYLKVSFFLFPKPIS